MNVSILNSHDVECEDFVLEMVGAKLCHMPAWTNMVEKTFGHKGFFLVARQDGVVCGVLPLTKVRSRLFGCRMISQAFSNYGGPLTKCPAATDSLCKRVVELATEHGCRSIELRNIDPIPCDFHLRTDKISMHLPLVDDPDELWHSFKPKIRNRVRKAEKSGIIIVRGSLELLDDFYRLWTVRMHELGTPCYPRKLFIGVMETFLDKCQIFVARLDDRIVGAVFAYCFNGMVQARWGASLIKYNNLNPISLLIWSITKHYCEAKAKCLDLGTSIVDSSQYEFKNRWRAEPKQLYYQYWVQPGHKLSFVKRDNPKYKNMIEIWKKLPLWITRFVGPRISCSLP